MNINTLYTLTESEYLEAQSLYIREKHRWQKYFRWFFVIFPLVVIVWLSLDSWYSGRHFDPGNVLGLLVPILFFGLLIPYSQKRAFKKRFAVEAPNMTSVRLSMDDISFRTSVANIGEGTIRWSAFSLWLEGEKLFILINAFTFRPIPKTALTPEDIDVFRSFLRINVPSSKSQSQKSEASTTSD